VVDSLNAGGVLCLGPGSGGGARDTIACAASGDRAHWSSGRQSSDVNLDTPTEADWLVGGGRRPSIGRGGGSSAGSSVNYTGFVCLGEGESGNGNNAPWTWSEIVAGEVVMATVIFVLSSDRPFNGLLGRVIAMLPLSLLLLLL